MKRTKLLSILSTAVTIAAILIVFLNLKNDYLFNENLEMHSLTKQELNLSNFQLKKLEELKFTDKDIDNELKIQTFWIKVIFSGLFSLAALFVILSKRYEDKVETKQWAFAILTLIAGIWIGTIAQ
jgi:hypothetical protein